MCSSWLFSERGERREREILLVEIDCVNVMSVLLSQCLFENDMDIYLNWTPLRAPFLETINIMLK